MADRTSVRMRPNLLEGVKLLRLHRGQMVVARSKKRFKVVVAGRRWGKTHFSATNLIKHALLKKKSLVWYVAPTYGMAKDIMWDTLLDLLPAALISRKNETKLSVRLINGSQIQLKGADKPDTLRGRGVDYVVLDEYQDFKTGTWEEVVFPTLTDKRGQALIIGTPKAYNQLYDVYIKGQHGAEQDWESWQFPTSSSPFIPKAEIETARRNLDPRTFRQEYEASFETMSGRVYYAFDRNVHVGKYELDPEKPLLVGQDFNVDPMCSAIMQWHPDKDELWIVDEIYMPSSSTAEVADELERRYWRHFKTRKIGVYPDPAGGARSSSRGESDLMIFREKGIRHIYYRAKHPPVADRINSVNSMLLSASGKVRIRVNSNCKHVIQSLEQTIYIAGTREVNKKLGKEHMADAIGYPVEYLFPANRIFLAGISR